MCCIRQKKTEGTISGQCLILGQPVKKTANYIVLAVTKTVLD